MYEIGTRASGTQTFKTYDPNVSIVMVPGVTYEAVFDARFTTPGWEEETYRQLVDAFAAYGCTLTYFGVCYPNQKILVQWQLAPTAAGGTPPEFQSALLPAIPATVLVLAALGVIGAAIGGVSFFKLSEIYESNPVGVGLVVGGVVFIGVLLALGYATRKP
jgi:hypothetical protein